MTTKKKNRFSQYINADINPVGNQAADQMVSSQENEPEQQVETIINPVIEEEEVVIEKTELETKVDTPAIKDKTTPKKAADKAVSPEVEAPKEEIKAAEQKQEETASNSGQEVNQETGEIIQTTPKRSLKKEKAKRINSGSFYIEESLDLVLLYLKNEYEATKSDIIEKALKAYLTTDVEIQKIMEDDEALSELIKNI